MGGALGSAGASEPVRIVAEAWSTASAVEDPFAPYAADRIRCSPFALRIEATWFGVDTSTCNHATVVFRFGVDTTAADHVTGELTWAPLTAPSSAVGTVAFATTRAGVLWTHDIPIPSDA